MTEHLNPDILWSDLSPVVRKGLLMDIIRSSGKQITTDDILSHAFNQVQHPSVRDLIQNIFLKGSDVVLTAFELIRLGILKEKVTVDKNGCVKRAYSIPKNKEQKWDQTYQKLKTKALEASY